MANYTFPYTMMVVKVSVTDTIEVKQGLRTFTAELARVSGFFVEDVGSDAWPARASGTAR